MLKNNHTFGKFRLILLIENIMYGKPHIVEHSWNLITMKLMLIRHLHHYLPIFVLLFLSDWFFWHLNTFAHFVLF